MAQLPRHVRSAIVGVVLALAGCFPLAARAQQVTNGLADIFTDKVKPIFESRCVACHSCNNAPCQLNLQNQAGAARGATTRNAYDRFRLRSVPPTRLDIDATSTADWRAKGFFDILGASLLDRREPSRSLLLRLVHLRAMNASAQPTVPVNESQSCPADPADQRVSDNPGHFGMPYGFPPLAAAEISALQSWVANGAPGPGGIGGLSSARASTETLPPAVRDEGRSWESYLNDPSPRQKLVSRYLYEHLFLANLHVPSASPAGTRPEFLRLVRSRTACERGVDEIATRRPTDDPGAADFQYCLRRATGSIVDKTHIPYDLTPAKLERIKTLFAAEPGTVEPDSTPQPAYGDEEAKNPFATFAAIPVKARYQFLLDDARYQIATFIKGPVCNGSTAVNSIQEQFFVFFLKPEADSMVASAEHAAKARDLLIMPGAWGSDVPLSDAVPLLKELVQHRERYRKLRATQLKSWRPKGYTLDDVWTGDNTNRNAVLTVFRHFDNAAVVQGAVGDMSKTVFMLDYPLFERLVYNLVVNFDVFGNVGHQSLTRLYMDMIRMEAEELYLTFLPPGQRSRIRREWYRGSLLTEAKLNYVFPLLEAKQPAGIVYQSDADARTELVQRLLTERITWSSDPLNWKKLGGPARDAGVKALTAPETAFRRLTSIPATNATPFARYFPDLAIVLLRRTDGNRQVYSIIHNREHQNVSWIGGETLRLAPAEDTLTIREGILGAYPNMLFVVPEVQADAFAAAAGEIRSPAAYAALVDTWGVRRTNARFWSIYDEITAHFEQTEPVQSGILDLTRYALEDH